MPLSGRIINVLAVPGEVFEGVRVAPPSTANWFVPALISVLIGWIGAWVIFAQPSVQQQLAELSQQAVEKQVEKMKASEEQAERMREAAEKFGSIGQKVSVVAAPLLMSFASPFVWGGFLWLVGKKVLKGDFHYMKAVEVVGLSNMVTIVEAIIKTSLIVIMGSLWAAPTLGLLVRDFDPQNPVHGILNALNIMTFWLLAVRASGLAKLARVGFGKAAAWVFGIWFAYTAFFMGIAFGLQAAFNR